MNIDLYDLLHKILCSRLTEALVDMDEVMDVDDEAFAMALERRDMAADLLAIIEDWAAENQHDTKPSCCGAVADCCGVAAAE